MSRLRREPGVTTSRRVWHGRCSDRRPVRNVSDSRHSWIWPLAVVALLGAVPSYSEGFACEVPPADQWRWEPMGKPASAYSDLVARAISESQKREPKLWKDERSLTSPDMIQAGYQSVIRILLASGVCAARAQHDDGTHYPALFIRKSDALLEEWRLFDEAGCLRADPYEHVWWIPRYEWDLPLEASNG